MRRYLDSRRQFAGFPGARPPPGNSPRRAGDLSQAPRRAGFSLIEAAVTVAVLALLVTSVFSISVESSSLLGDIEVEQAVQLEGNRALGRITDVLRKTGRVKEDGVEFPRVSATGTALEFRLPEDVDGNGYPFAQEAGALEWSPEVFSIQMDAQGVLAVYRSGKAIYPIARHVTSVRFQTIDEDPSLGWNEISVALQLQKTLKTGHDIVFSPAATAQMRN